MARANIARIHPDGSGEFIYLHFGEPLEYGTILLEHYQTDEHIQALLDMGNLSSIGPVIGEKVDFDKVAHSNALRHQQCLAYHRDRNEPWDDCKSRLFTGGLDQFHQDADDMSRWLYAHTPDGWAACRAEPDCRWSSIPDAVLADATARLDATKQGIQADLLDPEALDRLTSHIAAITGRPWQTPALRQLLADANGWSRTGP